MRISAADESVPRPLAGCSATAASATCPWSWRRPRARRTAKIVMSSICESCGNWPRREHLGSAPRGNFDYALADGRDWIGESRGIGIIVDRRDAPLLLGRTIDFLNGI